MKECAKHWLFSSRIEHLQCQIAFVEPTAFQAVDKSLIFDLLSNMDMFYVHLEDTFLINISILMLHQILYQ